MIYLVREGKFREERVTGMTLPELNYWIGKVSGYIEELNRRLKER